MKILIAEDDPAIQKIIEKIMKHWGYEFDIVSNGQEAVDHVQANEAYDLCLMDMDMPIMTGWDASKLIRQKLKYLPILAVTGSGKMKETYAQFGINDFLEKPYKLDQLHKKIHGLTLQSEKTSSKPSN